MGNNHFILGVNISEVFRAKDWSDPVLTRLNGKKEEEEGEG